MEELRARTCKRLSSLGIDTEELLSPAYVVWHAGTTNRVVVPARHWESISGLLISFTNTGSGCLLAQILGMSTESYKDCTNITLMKGMSWKLLQKREQNFLPDL
jgi:hypothetical protein